MSVLLKISYIGTSYNGFQSQKNGNTVQEKLTEAASAAFGFGCLVTGCSRTDGGVHANGFCATVAGRDGREITVPTDKIPIAANIFLPPDIAVVNAARVPDSFHPRYDVKNKTYIYKIYAEKIRNPFYVGRVMEYPRTLSDKQVSDMDARAKDFIGFHDFRAFMACGSKIEDTRRTVFECGVKRKGDIVEFSVCADGFLYNMVRIMVGTLLRPEADVSEIIKNLDRSRAGMTAPACGLYLDSVEYAETINWVL